MEIKDRLIQFIGYLGIPTRHFELRIGAANGYVNSIRKGISLDKLERILSEFPELSREWLLTGEGEMLTGRGAVEPIAPSGTRSAEPDADGETRPVIPYNAAAGILSGDVPGVTLTQCEQRPLVRQFPPYAFSIVARGDSMLPVIESGDELACQPLPSGAFIEWGRCYVLDTAQGIIVKRLYEGADGTLLCRSYNADYPDFTLPKTDVRTICRIVGLIRTNI